MNAKSTIVTCVALIVGAVGGAAATYSWFQDQHEPGEVRQKDDHDHEAAGHDDHDGHDVDEGGDDHDDHDAHGDDDRDAHGDDDHDAHGDDDDDAHGDDAHDDHGAETEALHFADDEIRELGIKIATAGPGKLSRSLKLPGEVIFNPDRVVHVTPRAPGIVREVLKTVGDAVSAGEVMAWLESGELGDAKVDYLSKWAELGRGTIDEARATEVHDNTMKLLAALKSSPSLEALREMDGGAMGENRSVLVSAYAEYVIAKAAYSREKPLFEKKIASEKEFQEADAQYKKADAVYSATRDSIHYRVCRDVLDARRAQQVRQIELKGAERHLYVLGLRAEEVKQLQLLAEAQAQAAHEEHEDTDTNGEAPSSRRSGTPAMPKPVSPGSDETLAWYAVRAPFDGTVIEKHLTLGEKHSDDSGAFTVADMSTVWVNLTVYQKDLAKVGAGQQVAITFGNDIPDARGRIDYVSPMIHEATRTATARVVLANPDRRWRPGSFVAARVDVEETEAALLVPKTAVQMIDGENCVFVATAGGFAPRPVQLGRTSTRQVEIESGLKPGDRYVADGAFNLKAQMITSGMDAHAGHGH